MDAAREDEWPSIVPEPGQPLLERRSGLLRDLELNRTSGLVLDDRRPVSYGTAGRDVVDPEGDEVAAAMLAVDSQIEQREIALRLECFI